MLLNLLNFAIVSDLPPAGGKIFKGAEDPLLFPAGKYILETIPVRTSGGIKNITYRSFKHILYVSNPVSKDYQSLDVSVPVEIDGRKVDCANAPILLDIRVAGYLAVNNTTGENGFSDGGTDSVSPLSCRSHLAMASGYVVVTPGCRGRDNLAPEGTYFGKAPAAIVDLKAAVRYIRHNKGIIPGNTKWIITDGCSAGGALSALLGTSGNDPLYDDYLIEIGAAEGDDRVYGSACYSPITDLEHSDMAYEWMYGKFPTRSGPVAQELSNQLKTAYAEYQKSLELKGRENFGVITAENYSKYLLKYYLIPSVNAYLNKLTDQKREEYLKKNNWVSWNNGTASFDFSDYVSHTGRLKGLPAFDDFDMRSAETVLFGDRTDNARHFTEFSLRHTGGDPAAEIDYELKNTVNIMNAMYFIRKGNSDFAEYWWLRNGSRDNHTSQTIMINLAAGLENRNKDVNAWIFWDEKHCADDDPEGFIEWISTITGYKQY